MLLTLYKIILTVLASIILPIILVFLSPIFIFRYILSKTTKFWSSDLGSILSPSSSHLGVDFSEWDSHNKPVWTNVQTLVLNGNTSFEDFKNRFLGRVVLGKNSKGDLLRPELQQFVVQRFGFSFWKWDEDFQLENHIQNGFDDFKYDVLNEDIMYRIAQSRIFKPFPGYRSPWELYFLENYSEGSGENDGEFKSAIVLRHHHALFDGYSLLKLWDLGFGDSKDLRPCESPDKRFMTTTFIKEAFRQIYQVFAIPLCLYYAVSNSVDIHRYRASSSGWFLDPSQLSRKTNGAYTTALSIQTLKNIKNSCNCSFGSVVFAAYTGALRRFMIEAGYKEVPKAILCLVAFPIPGTSHPDDKLGNYFTNSWISLPTGLSTPMARLKETHKYLKGNLSALSLLSAYYVMTWTGRFFTQIIKAMHSSGNAAVTGVVVASPIKAVTGGGLTLEKMGGILGNSSGLGFVFMSYNGKLVVTVTIDEALVPESRLPATKLIEYLNEELELLSQAANTENNFV